MHKVLFIDKPKGITSFDLCFKLRKVFNTRVIGHTGTLDPNATGVMVVLLNNACKLNQFLVKDDKTYQGKVKIGIRTDSLDIDGKVLETKTFNNIDFEMLQLKSQEFIGKIKQKPPMVSAIKVNGKKLLEYQKDNQNVDIKARDVEIFDFKLFNFNGDEFEFEASVSSGTYIRVLIEDLLKSIGVFGILLELRRTRVGGVRIEDCDLLEDVLKNNYQLKNPLDILEKKYPLIEIENYKDVSNGKKINLDCKEDEVVLVSKGALLAIYSRESGNIFKCERGLFWK